MIHIIIEEPKPEQEPGVYKVNGKVVDTLKPLWGRNLTGAEHTCLITTITAIKRNAKPVKS